MPFWRRFEAVRSSRPALTRSRRLESRRDFLYPSGGARLPQLASAQLASTPRDGRCPFRLTAAEADILLSVELCLGSGGQCIRMAVRSLSKFYGGVVRAHRARLNLTQEQVAERASIHPTYVGMVERGERNCSLDIAAAIATALGVPLSELVAEAEGESRAGALNRKARRV